jgi:hypothetical protein
LFVAFVGVAVVDYDCSEVAPLRHKSWELILIAYDFLSTKDVGLESLQLIKKFSRVSLEAIDCCYYFGNVVFVLLLRADVPMPLVLFWNVLLVVEILFAFVVGKLQALKRPFFLKVLDPRKALREQTQKINQCTRVREQRIVGQLTMSHIVSQLAYHFFELSGVLARDEEEFADEKEVKELLLDFWVH